MAKNSYLILIISFFLSSCEKLIEIRPPANSITTGVVFKDSADANSAIMGVYSKLANTGTSVDFGTGALTTLLGMYADELSPNDQNSIPYLLSTVSPNDPELTKLWITPYKIIYQINASVEGLNQSETIKENVRKRYIGELTVLRGLCYFYLTQVFGDVPYVTSTDWKKTSQSPKDSKDIIYDSVVKDVLLNIEFLDGTYDRTNGERTRVTKWAAYALLSKILVTQGKWMEAYQFSKLIIDRPDIFQLETELSKVFLKNSKEAILQWDQNVNMYPYAVTTEGYTFKNGSNRPRFFLVESLLADFSKDDNRFKEWITSIEYQGKKYYFPNKYKKGSQDSQPNSTSTEYYTVFRLGEVLLTNAEAAINLNRIEDAIIQVKKIRTRANVAMGDLGSTLSDQMNSILSERRKELFCEWGSRFFDLKRFGKLDQLLGATKPTWKSRSNVLPIPISELRTNPFLKQNEGY